MTDMTDMTTLSLEDIQAELFGLDDEIAGLRNQLERLAARRVKVANFKELFEEFVAARSVPKANSLLDGGPDLAEASPVTIVGGSVDILREKGEWLDTRRLIHFLEARGFKSQAGNVYTSVFGTLNREVKRPGTELAKIDGQWGLGEWLTGEEQGEDQGSEEESLFEVATFSQQGGTS